MEKLLIQKLRKTLFNVEAVVRNVFGCSDKNAVMGEDELWYLMRANKLLVHPKSLLTEIIKYFDHSCKGYLCPALTLHSEHVCVHLCKKLPMLKPFNRSCMRVRAFVLDLSIRVRAFVLDLSP